MTTPFDAELDALAAGPLDDADQRTLDRIAGLYDTLDPVPAGLVDRISFGITLEALHAEIAELQRAGDLAGVRSTDATETRTVTFSSASRSLMITLSPASIDTTRIDGWIVPAGAATIELRTATGVLHASADEDGRFVFEAAPRGFGQFVVRPPDGEDASPVITPSIEF